LKIRQSQGHPALSPDSLTGWSQGQQVQVCVAMSSCLVRARSSPLFDVTQDALGHQKALDDATTDLFSTVIPSFAKHLVKVEQHQANKGKFRKDTGEMQTDVQLEQLKEPVSEVCLCFVFGVVVVVVVIVVVYKEKVFTQITQLIGMASVPVITDCSIVMEVCALLYLSLYLFMSQFHFLLSFSIAHVTFILLHRGRKQSQSTLIPSLTSFSAPL